MADVKTVNGLALASMKTRNGLAAASVKTINGLDSAAAAGPFGGLVSTTDLVDSWPLSEASGTRVGVHAGLDLTDVNTVTGGNDGVAYSQFTAANTEYLNRASEAALQTGDFDYCLCGWLYLDSKTTYQHYWAKNEQGGGNQREFVLYYDQPSDRLVWSVQNSTPNIVGSVSATTFGSPPTSTWFFVYTQNNSTGNTIGVSVNNGTLNTTAHLATPASSTCPFRLGNDVRSGTQYPHNGRMRRVNFFKRLLTAGEISALYNSGNGLDY